MTRAAVVQVVSTRGLVAVRGARVDWIDLARVLAAATAIDLPPGRRILRMMPQRYRVDSQCDTADPLGVVGRRLELEALVVTTR